MKVAPWRGRGAAVACTVAGAAGALANALLMAFGALMFARPGPVAMALGPLAAVSAGLSAALLVPVALALGTGDVVTLGVVAMVALAATWWLVAGGLLGSAPAAALVMVAGLMLAGWLVLVCRQPTVPPRAARLGRRVGVVAFTGTVVVGLALVVAMPDQLRGTFLVLGGLPAAGAWLTMPAWSVRMGLWLRQGQASPVGSRATGT